jgi:3-hydroxyacyl-CoA dehydrogenase
MAISTVGVVGGGVMGAGIAQTLLSAGYRVLLREVDEEYLRRGVESVTSLLAAWAKKAGLAEDDARKRLASLRGTTSYSSLFEADFVVEAVPEILSLKGEVLAQLARTCAAGVVLASNTSSLSISELAAFTDQPARVVGMHWFNPPQRMRLIEVIPGLETAEEAVESCLGLAKDLGKTPVIVKECAGFLVNRLLGAYVAEAVLLVEEGKSPQQVDGAARGLGLPMGPLELGDMVGWDTIFRSNGNLENEYGHRFEIPRLMAETVREGRLGAKTGRGFYEYLDGRPTKSQSPDASPDTARRLLLSLINEGVRCLDEGVASALDIDTALKLAAGLPKGPLEWADELGLTQVLADLEALRSAHGERFIPSALLRRKVAARQLGRHSGKGFHAY